MASDLGRWMGALSDIEQAHKESKNPPIFKKLYAGKSVEEEAMEAFAAKQKAESMRNDLKNYVGMMYGKSKWDELVRMEGSIRKKRAETLYRQREKRKKFVEICAWVVMISIGVGVLTSFVLLLKAHTARADEIMTTCRKVKCEKLEDKKMVCIFKGQNNTIESMFFSYGEFIPSEYQCKYDPKAKQDLTIQETLKQIRESQK
tara:strand:+ start:7075 stop:7683 length:609 start_codon:yes stop_codon:yes gene_type:complete